MNRRMDFQSSVGKAMAAPGFSHMRPVIEKEPLHYDLLFILDKENLLDNLAFRGIGGQYLFHVQHHNRAMKNITIKLENDVARRYKVWAAEHNTRVSRILGNLTTINPFLVDSNALKN